MLEGLMAAVLKRTVQLLEVCSENVYSAFLLVPRIGHTDQYLGLGRYMFCTIADSLM